MVSQAHRASSSLTEPHPPSCCLPAGACAEHGFHDDCSERPLRGYTHVSIIGPAPASAALSSCGKGAEAALDASSRLRSKKGSSRYQTAFWLACERIRAEASRQEREGTFDMKLVRRKVPSKGSEKSAAGRVIAAQFRFESIRPESRSCSGVTTSSSPDGCESPLAWAAHNGQRKSLFG